MSAPAAPRRRAPADGTRAGGRTTRPARTPPRRTPRKPGPILVRQVRNGIEESVHRGDVVEVDASGRIVRLLGDADRVVNLRSTVKPFGVVALLEAGGRAAFDLQPAEIALMASSHSGEDVHVRTLQALFRRAQISQAVLACGSADMPLDRLTAARLARDGEKPGPLRHMCSGQHAVSILLSRLRGWDPTDYWHDDHPSQVAYREVVARAFGTTPQRLRTGIDGCGVLTYAFPLREVARAYAMLAEPSAVAAADPRSSLAEPLTAVRDAMLAHPEMVGGSRDRLDTSLMKAVPGRVVSKAGMEALRAIAILPGAGAAGAVPSAGVPSAASHSGGVPSGMALKIEDGGGYDRASWAATVEALRQAGVLDAAALRALARYHRPVTPDPHGRPAAEAIPEFELAPVGELIR